MLIKKSASLNDITDAFSRLFLGKTDWIEDDDTLVTDIPLSFFTHKNRIKGPAIKDKDGKGMTRSINKKHVSAAVGIGRAGPQISLQIRQKLPSGNKKDE